MGHFVAWNQFGAQAPRAITERSPDRYFGGWGLQLCVPDFGMARLMASTWVLELKPSHTWPGFLCFSA